VDPEGNKAEASSKVIKAVVAEVDAVVEEGGGSTESIIPCLLWTTAWDRVEF
jgi:hypothetical protein